MLSSWVTHTQTLGNLSFYFAFNEEISAVVPFVTALAKNTSLDSITLRRGYALPSFEQKLWDPPDASLGRAVASLISDNHTLRSLEIGFDAKAVLYEIGRAHV